MPPRQSLSSRAKQGGDDAQRDRNMRHALDDRVRASQGYLNAIIPEHMNAAQFVAIVLGLLHKDDRLAVAAMANPESFMAALADCARLGLVPGDGYALVPFNNRKTGVPDIVGITEYTGEIELMYRSGGVLSVVAEVVRENDYFRRGDTPHSPPDFHPQPDEFATDEQRGDLRGVFAYAVLETGQISRVVVMGRGEVMKHKNIARTTEVWEGDFAPSMWLKTAVHELYKWVPRSVEYRRELMRSGAAVVNAAAIPGAPDALPAAATTIPSPPAGPLALPNGKQGGRRHSEPPERLTVIDQQWQTLKVTDRSERARLIKTIIPQWDGHPEHLTPDQLTLVSNTLQEFIDSDTGAADLAAFLNPPAGEES